MVRYVFSFIVLFIVSKNCLSQSFTNITNSQNINHTYGDVTHGGMDVIGDTIGLFGGGVSFVDFDKDGWDDLSLSSGVRDSIQFYKNNQGIFFPIPIITDTNETKHILWVDFDNDNDRDLYISSYYQGSRLYENDGNMNFTDITSSAGLHLDSFPSFGATFGDYNNDGWLDLYTTNRAVNTMFPSSNHLFKNNGDGTFTETTIVAGVADSLKAPFCASFFDFNNDGWQDIYIAQDKYFGNTLFKNNGNGTFSDVSVSSGSDIAMDGMSIAIGDYDNDGWQDIYITNSDLGGHKLLHNEGNETFSEVALSAGVVVNGFAWGSDFFDYDNDSDLDLVVCGGEGFPWWDKHNILFENNNNGTFTEVTTSGFYTDYEDTYSCARGDANNDGYYDFVVSNVSPWMSKLFQNNTTPTNNWIKVNLTGTASNRDGIGAVIKVYLDGDSTMRQTICGTSFLAKRGCGLFLQPLCE